MWVHAVHTDVSVTLAGQDGEDAKHYQEKEITGAIRKSKVEESHSA